MGLILSAPANLPIHPALAGITQRMRRRTFARLITSLTPYTHSNHYETQTLTPRLRRIAYPCRDNRPCLSHASQDEATPLPVRAVFRCAGLALHGYDDF